jgi:hypothetical protein
MVVLTYGVPLWGLPTSVILAILTFSLRRQLWPGGSGGRDATCAALGLVGLWWPGMTYFLTGWAGPAAETSTAWLIIPLCGPDGYAQWFIPALTASVAAGAGLWTAIARRQPWFWVLGAWLAPWVHQLTLSLMPNHEFVC